MVQSPDAEEMALVDQANALVREGRGGEAEAAMQARKADLHLGAAARSWLCWYLTTRRVDLPQAIANGERAVALRPAWGFTRLNLARAHDAAGHWKQAYLGYLDALACGNAQDEAFAERRASELSAAANGRGEDLPSFEEGSPAHRRTEGVERVMRAIVGQLAAMPELASRAWFAAVGIPVPEGDVPFGWIGQSARGRVFVHALAFDFGIVARIEVLARSAAGPVWRGQREAEVVAEAVASIAEWVRGLDDDPQSITPLDAAVMVRTALLAAVPGWRLRISGGADRDAPERPASLAVVQRRRPWNIGVAIRARAGGGVLVTPMADLVIPTAAPFEAPTYDAMKSLLPALVESSVATLAAFAGREAI